MMVRYVLSTAKGTEEKAVYRGLSRYMVHNNGMDVQERRDNKGVGNLWQQGNFEVCSTKVHHSITPQGLYNN